MLSGQNSRPAVECAARRETFELGIVAWLPAVAQTAIGKNTFKDRDGGRNNGRAGSVAAIVFVLSIQAVLAALSVMAVLNVLLLRKDDVRLGRRGLTALSIGQSSIKVRSHEGELSMSLLGMSFVSVPVSARYVSLAMIAVRSRGCDKSPSPIGADWVCLKTFPE